MHLKTITGPTVEPLTVAEARAHCYAPDGVEEDALLSGLITTMREVGEQKTGRAWVPVTLELIAAGFPRGCGPNARLALPRPPLQSVTSVVYYALDGVQQTMDVADYIADTDAIVGGVYPAGGNEWPETTKDRHDAVRVRFVAGYPTTGSPEEATTPQSLCDWMKVRVATAYEHREAVTAVSRELAEMPHPYVDGLLDRFKVWESF